MKLGHKRSLRARASLDGTTAVLVYEVDLVLEESDMVPLGKDIQKAVANINALLRENADLRAELEATRKALKEEQAKPQGITTDDETDAVLGTFRDLVASLPDVPSAPQGTTAPAAAPPVAAAPAVETDDEPGVTANTLVLQ